MTKQQLQDLVLATAALAKFKAASALPCDVARDMGKLQKLASSLSKRYYEEATFSWAQTREREEKTRDLEKRAQELAKVLGIKLAIDTQANAYPPFVLIIAGNEYELG